MQDRNKIIRICTLLLDAYKNGQLGQTIMPEDSSPVFSMSEQETKIAYFSLPMALNYQRNSYELWKSALKTYRDEQTKSVFNVKIASKLSTEKLRECLTKHKLALQPNKHVDTWHRISQTVSENWGTFAGLINAANIDFLQLKQLLQVDYKKGFPYLSGEKIFNYWTFILNRYCELSLKNSQYIDIAPDTHIIKCSVLIGVISKKEAEMLTRDKISERWRTILEGTGINPIEMHPPLWFWSKNNFIYTLPEL